MEGRWETGLFRYAVYLDEVMSDAKRRQEDKAGAEAGGRANPGLDRLGGRSRIKLGEDRPHIEFLPEVGGWVLTDGWVGVVGWAGRPGSPCSHLFSPYPPPAPHDPA